MKKFWNWIHDDGGGRILRLEGPIDSENFWGDEITPQMFRKDLEAEEGDVTVWINSPGGNVFAAAEIYTMLKDYAGKVTVKVASLAAYAAKSGLRRGRIADLMSEETWLNAKKAVELGFADEVLYDGRKPEEDKDPEKEDALPAEAQLFSTRVMDMAILDRLGITRGTEEPPSAPVIGMDGKTKEGAMPFEILKNQLDFLR